jgi:hypothetical protein
MLIPKTILFVEDKAKDVELTLAALEECNFSGRVVVARDGVEALDQLGVNAYVVKPVQFAQFAEAVQQAGLFWAALNELPACAGTCRS